MYQLDLPWMLIIVPLPLLIWWLMPPHRETSASIRLPFFTQVARAAGAEPTEGSVVPKRFVAASTPRRASGTVSDRSGAGASAICRAAAREDRTAAGHPARPRPLSVNGDARFRRRRMARLKPGRRSENCGPTLSPNAQAIASGRLRSATRPIRWPPLPYHPLVRTLVEGLLPGIAGPRMALGDPAGGLHPCLEDNDRAGQSPSFHGRK